MPLADMTWRTRRLAGGYYSLAVETPENQPVRTFLPIGYEPNYPYPLLVFLHRHGGNEEQVLKLAPKMSRRNYVAISLRGPARLSRSTKPAFGWTTSDGADDKIDDYVINAIEHTRRNYHVHSERIYLVGVREGASVAYRMGLNAPHKFAGVVALNGTMPMPGQNRPLFRLPTLRQLQVMIAHGKANEKTPLALAQKDFLALYGAGVDVRFRHYETNHKLHADMLRDVNRWIMRHVAGEHE